MSKPEWFGIAVLGCGAVFGFLQGGAFGMALACGCLIVGLVLFVAAEARGTKRPTGDIRASSPSHSHILVLLKEAHVRPLRNGKFQEISDPNQTGLQFEIFVHCWLVNNADQQFGIAGLRFALTKVDGTAVALERVTGDLENWKLGRLRDEVDSWGVRYLQAAQEAMPELRTEEPMEGGSSRQGWLHLRAENITPAELKYAKLELNVLDSGLTSHHGELKGPHQLPGQVWPFSPKPAPSANPSVAVAQDSPSASPGAGTLSQLDTAN